MENEEIIEADRIVACDWDENGGVLEYDISYLHPDLGVLLQEYTVSSMTYEGKRIFQSSFSLFALNSDEVGEFSYLPKEIKMRLWDVVFAIKLKFFSQCQPDIVEHFIDGAYSLTQRYELYRSKLNPLGYDIELEKTKRTITYQKAKIPSGSGGDFCLS
jgi:hypothetical protein